MTKEKTCLFCLFCKLIDIHKRLSCSKGMWIREDLDRKFIILTKTERKSLDLNHRDIFNLAGRCNEFKDME